MVKLKIEMGVPEFELKTGGKLEANTLYAKFTMPISKIGGYAHVTTGTATSPRTRQQLLIFECSIKEGCADKNVDAFFATSHQMQQAIFEDFFTAEILKKWV